MTDPLAAGAAAGLVVLSGPSGVGKGSVVSVLRRRHPSVWISVSWTTRPPRTGERDGIDYHFVSEQRFADQVRREGFLEHARYAGHGYGTPREPVEAHLADGRPALLEIDLQGARQVRRRLPRARLVFLAPPSWPELVRRLEGRGTDDAEAVARRLASARAELDAAAEFDAVVVNDTLEAAADAVLAEFGRAVTAP